MAVAKLVTTNKGYNVTCLRLYRGYGALHQRFLHKRRVMGTLRATLITHLEGLVPLVPFALAVVSVTSGSAV